MMSTNERSDERLDGWITGWLEQTAPPRLPDRVLASTFERTRGSRQQGGWRARLGRIHVARPAFALGGAVAAVLVAAVAFNAYSDRPAVGPGGPLPSDAPRSPFLGIWYSTSDADGGTQTMTIDATGDAAVAIVVNDDVASVCSGGPSTMTGTGSVDGDKLVIPAPDYRCDDGSKPRALSGPPLQEQLRNLTYVYDAKAGAVTVGPRSVWTRQIAVAPSAGPTTAPSEAEITGSPAQAVDLLNLTKSFVSPTNGFSFKYLGLLTPAKQLWGFGKQPDADDLLPRRWADDGYDFVETGKGAGFKGASMEMPDVQNGFLVGEPPLSIDEWIDGIVDDVHSGCGVPRRQQAEITIDGQSGRISECPGDPGEIVATVVAGGRLYLFALGTSRSDARAFFDAFAATIDLRPEDAAAPGSVYPVGTPSPS